MYLLDTRGTTDLKSFTTREDSKHVQISRHSSQNLHFVGVYASRYASNGPGKIGGLRLHATRVLVIATCRVARTVEKAMRGRRQQCPPRLGFVMEIGQIDIHAS